MTNLAKVVSILLSVRSVVAQISVWDSPAGSSIQSDNFVTYTDHCANWGYQFNPQTNQLYNFDYAASNFADAANGDFSLLRTSTAKAAGTKIAGITSSANPDCGAWKAVTEIAGANLVSPSFKEATGTATAVVQPKLNDDQLLLYPNPASRYLTI